MSTTGNTLAVYTTIYPAVKPYIREWYSSLCKQTDSEFALWIGLDCMAGKEVVELAGRDLEASWIEAAPGSTPAQIRQQALAKIVRVSSEVVLVDSDDLLHPSRVVAARAALKSCELTGCALRLIDERGKSLNATFTLPSAFQADDVFPRNNAFGFSNSAYRVELLERVLPIPSEAVLVATLTPESPPPRRGQVMAAHEGVTVRYSSRAIGAGRRACFGSGARSGRV